MQKQFLPQQLLCPCPQKQQPPYFDKISLLSLLGCSAIEAIITWTINTIAKNHGQIHSDDSRTFGQELVDLHTTPTMFGKALMPAQR